MKKVNIGDIFEIDTRKGKAYIQCVLIDKLKGELIKVYNKISNKRPENIENFLEEEDYYFIGFPLISAYRKRIVEFVENIALPQDFELPKFMRDIHKVRGEFKGWFIIDRETNKHLLVNELTEDQKKLSPAGIVNDTWLKERLEEGWSLKNWE